VLPAVSVEPRDDGIARRPIIEVQRVSRVYAGATGPVVALRDVDVEIARGEFVSFVGPSGCGKSTLLNIIAGLLPPSSGSVLLDGDEIREPSRNVGFMFQAPVLLPWRTVEKNVLLPAEVFGGDRRVSVDKARAAIELVGLTEFTGSLPRQLSGGMQQRVALARVLAYEPELILMDEPFGALDEFTREAMNLELLRVTNAADVTVGFVTHNIAEAVFLSSRVVVMTPRPGEVAGIVDVALPMPREISMMHDRIFSDLVFEVRGLLGGKR
jgi:NitT/TauT family transport system ATP-binding protein